jgi:hypothetical protein
MEQNYETASPTWRPALRSEKRVNQQLANHPVKSSSSPHYLHKETSEKNLAGSATPSGLDDFAVNRQSSRAYFFGFVGGLIYRGSPSEKVRFHAAQSRWIDIFAVVYFVIAMILTIIYLAIRYPGPGPHEIAPNDPVMWAWTLTALLGPPITHITLAILALLGKNPRIPLVWKIAATVSARQRESLTSDGEKLLTQSPMGQDLSSPERPTAEDARSLSGRYRPLSRPAGEVCQSTDHEFGWDFFRTDRGNEEGSYVAFTAYKWPYWVLVFLVLIIDLFAIVAIFTSPSLGVKIFSGISATFLTFLLIGFGGMAKSPIRLEIGSRGVQLFARSGTTWLPWEAIEKIAIKRITGIPHLVAWLHYSNIFPDSDALGGGPRFLPKINAIAICSLSVMHAPRHQIVRALRTYGGRSAG